MYSKPVYILQYVIKRVIYVANYGWICKNAELGIFVSIMFLSSVILCVSLWSLFLWSLSIIFHVSNSAITSWTPYEEDTEERKEELRMLRRSCAPNKFFIGEFSLVKKGKVLKFLHAISRGTFKVLKVL